MVILLVYNYLLVISCNALFAPLITPSFAPSLFLMYLALHLNLLRG
jgi:hypothetical protein